MMGLFGQAKRDPKELVREWQTKLRKESRVLDRQIQSIQREEDKVKKSLKDAAKKGDKDVLKVLAKEIVHSRKAISKIHAAKAQLKSVEYGMTQQLAVLRMSGAMQQSAEVMKSMQQLCKVSEVSAAMRELSKEMTKAGIMEEMMEDAFSGMEDDEELEEDVQKEVDKVLSELTAGQIGKIPDAGKDTLPVLPDVEDTAEDDEDISGMQERLEALRS